MDVEILDYCHSACAAYIFPAGRFKYVHSNSLITFHGNAQQKNVLELAKAVDDSKATNENNSVVGRVGKEVVIGNMAAAEQKERAEVRRYIGMHRVHSTVDVFNRLRALELDFYDALGVDPKIATYGQLGVYSSAYGNSAYDSFYYSMASLERLGITNIRLIDGVWNLSGNPLLSHMYEVVLPVQ
jgi:hypothetical protein